MGIILNSSTIVAHIVRIRRKFDNFRGTAQFSFHLGKYRHGFFHPVNMRSYLLLLLIVVDQIQASQYSSWIKKSFVKHLWIRIAAIQAFVAFSSWSASCESLLAPNHKYLSLVFQEVKPVWWNQVDKREISICGTLKLQHSKCSVYLIWS